MIARLAAWAAEHEDIRRVVMFNVDRHTLQPPPGRNREIQIELLPSVSQLNHVALARQLGDDIRALFQSSDSTVLSPGQTINTSGRADCVEVYTRP
jgi:hypothetical protein